MWASRTRSTHPTITLTTTKLRPTRSLRSSPSLFGFRCTEMLPSSSPVTLPKWSLPPSDHGVRPLARLAAHLHTRLWNMSAFFGRTVWIPLTTGESYAGVYVPTLAEALLSAVDKGTYSGAPLVGIAVGNGCSGTEVGVCGGQRWKYDTQVRQQSNTLTLTWTLI